MTTGEMRYLWLVDLSAKRALRGQTPSNLRAYSFAVDAGHRSILLRAHFAISPSEADIDDIQVVETEIATDFADEFETRTEMEVVPCGTPPNFLAGGIAYLRKGEGNTYQGVNLRRGRGG